MAGNKDLKKKQKLAEKANADAKRQKKADFLRTKMEEFNVPRTVAHGLQVADRPSASVVIAPFKIQGFSGALQISVPNGKVTAKELASKVEDAISLALGILDATAQVYAGEESDDTEE
jgi:hypothetical protein